MDVTSRKHYPYRQERGVFDLQLPGIDISVVYAPTRDNAAAATVSFAHAPDAAAAWVSIQQGDGPSEIAAALREAADQLDKWIAADARTKETP